MYYFQIWNLKFEISNFKSQISNLKFAAGASMKYERFEDLPVWNAAAELAVQMFEWTSHSWFRGKGDLANQL